MKKKLLWGVGVLFVITTISFLVYPSLFTGGKSTWREYTNFDDISNFDTESYDLYRRVSINTVYLEDDNPFMTLEDTKVTYYFYYGASRTNDSMWPHNYIINFIHNARSYLNFYCITAVQDNKVLAKDCKETPLVPADYEVVSSSAVQVILESGVMHYMFSVAHIDDVAEKEGWIEEDIRFFKKRFKNDKDYMILVDLKYEANE
ncbi:hypothetical protein RJG79_08480 [Mycoplasmatota bacterium WC44]